MLVLVCQAGDFLDFFLWVVWHLAGAALGPVAMWQRLNLEPSLIAVALLREDTEEKAVAGFTTGVGVG